MSSFYGKTIASLNLPKESSILVVCGGEFDRDVFQELEFPNVTISNVDERIRGGEFAPYEWSFQDAEQLSFPDKSFDYVVVHAGLHHCSSPHRALLEMYRVAVKGLIAFEARDSALIKAAKQLGFVPDYELGAVLAHEMRWGGVRNSCIPNYVYRWTESEVRKTIASYAPYAPHDIRFFYDLRLPSGRLPFEKTRGLRWIPVLIENGVRVISFVLPKQCNLFAFYIAKPGCDVVFPWLKNRNEFNPNFKGIGRSSPADSWY